MSQVSETGLWRNELPGSWRARVEVRPYVRQQLWEQLLILKRLGDKVLHGGPCRGPRPGGSRAAGTL